jgi:hypothetical protein
MHFGDRGAYTLSDGGIPAGGDHGQRLGQVAAGRDKRLQFPQPARNAWVVAPRQASGKNPSLTIVMPRITISTAHNEHYRPSTRILDQERHISGQVPS